MKFRYVHVDVFSDVPFGGNQLAVLPDAAGLSSATMQAIAREFNFAETAFVLAPQARQATHRLRIFSPTAEMPFAGHPTVGAAAALAQLRLVPLRQGRASVVFEETAGQVQVTVTTTEGGLYSEMIVRHPLQTSLDLPPAQVLAAALSLQPDAVRRSWYAGVGLPFCLCQVASDDDVDAAILDRVAWRAALGTGWAQNLFFFAGDLTDGAELYARMFAPAMGIDEDPATGSAAAALVGLAVEPRRRGETHLLIRQGVTIGRPSLIMATASHPTGSTDHVRVGGHVTPFADGVLSAAAT